MSDQISTTEKGDAFRDTLISHLAAAGFECKTETRVAFKKADGLAIWQRDSLDGPVRYLIEAKDYSGTLPLDQCAKFQEQYGALVRSGGAERAWLISRGPISPDGRLAIDGAAGLKCFTFAEFQRAILNVDGYLRDIVESYKTKRISEFFVEPHTDEGHSLTAVVRDWVAEPTPPPMAIISGYGKGKSTFALHLAADMAKAALKDPTKRVPLLIELGEVMDVTGIDGLVSRVLGRNHRAIGYHFHLFSELNKSGRFIVILDGFDEMKHGMTLAMFERAFSRLLEFSEGDSRLLILGRDTAFHNDREFNSIILGRQTTSLGASISLPGRSACRPISLREFNGEEVERYVRSYFPIALQKVNPGLASDNAWVDERIADLLSKRENELVSRPVHAQMFCELATDPKFDLAGVTKLRLYDAFVHFLLHREIEKTGRDPAINHDARRKYNAAIAWWLWAQGQASTASLDSIPISIALEAADGIKSDYDDIGLKRELSAGLLVEKAGSAIYFGHRSIQEFLVSEHIIKSGPQTCLEKGVDISDLFRSLNQEIIDFISLYFIENDARVEALKWISATEDIRTRVPAAELGLPVRLAALHDLASDYYLTSFWFFIIGHFVANGSTKLDVRAQSKARVIDHFVAGLGNAATEEAAVLMLGHLMGRNPATFGPSLAKIIAAWTDLPAFARHVDIASRGKSHISQVRRDDSFRLWSLIQVLEINSEKDELEVSVDVNKLAEFANKARVGLADGVVLNIESLDRLVVPVQSVYRELARRNANLKDAEKLLEGIRPYFTSREVRDRVRPLTVERKGKRASL